MSRAFLRPMVVVGRGRKGVRQGGEEEGAEVSGRVLLPKGLGLFALWLLLVVDNYSRWKDAWDGLEGRTLSPPFFFSRSQQMLLKLEAGCLSQRLLFSRKLEQGYA